MSSNIGALWLCSGRGQAHEHAHEIAGVDLKNIFLRVRVKRVEHEAENDDKNADPGKLGRHLNVSQRKEHGRGNQENRGNVLLKLVSFFVQKHTTKQNCNQLETFENHLQQIHLARRHRVGWSDVSGPHCGGIPR